MNQRHSETSFEVTHEELMTMDEYETRMRSEAREAAANSVRRIQLEGAREVARLQERYQRELEAQKAYARRTTRRLTSGFSIAFLVGAASLLASLVEVPSLMPDVAFQEDREFEVAGLQVALSSAEAESELQTEPDESVVPEPAYRSPKSTARPAPRPRSSSIVDPCAGDPYDPLNFCL